MAKMIQTVHVRMVKACLMCDHHQRRRALEHAAQRHRQGFRVERGETFVQDHQVGALQQRARDIQPAALAVR
jgi:hypothetical protein